MRRILGAAIFLFLITTSYTDPQYEFRLVLEKEFKYVDIQIADLDGDGLSEILFFTSVTEGEKDHLLTALNVCGETIWQTWVDESSRTVYFEDADNDGQKEIFFTQDIDPYKQEPGIKEMRITCIDDGIVLWSHQFQAHLGPYETFRQFEYLFSDVNNDGYKEILAANYVFDRNGTILHQYDEDFSIFEVTDIDGDAQEEIFLKKVSHDFYLTLSDNSFRYKIVEIDGSLIWEEEFSEPTFLHVLDIEGEKRIFILQLDETFEITLDNTEKWRVSFDSDPCGIPVDPEILVCDINCDNRVEYVITTMDCIKDYGKGSIHVYDTQLHTLWEHTDPVFKTYARDFNQDNRYEFLTKYKFFSRFPFYKMFNDQGIEMWNLVFETSVYGPDIIDLDADGLSEIVFNVYPPVRKEKTNATLKELLEKLKTLSFDNDKSTNYLYVFDSEGVLEKQFEIPFSSSTNFYDFDDDGDLDLLFYTIISGRKIYLYTNTLYKGALDEISVEEKKIGEVDLGEKWFKRNAYINVWSSYKYEEIKNILDDTSLLYTRYKKEFSILLEIVIFLCVASSAWLARRLERRESEWELWSVKKVVLYLALSVLLPPAALIYFICTIWKSSEYKKALGFTRPTKRQILISAVVGGLLFLTGWIVLVLLAMNHVTLPDTSSAEYIVEHYFVIAVFLWAVTAPIVEEIAFSGHLYPVVRTKWGVRPGIVMTAILFSVLHLSPVVLPVFFVGALIKLYAYERTHCIYIPVIIHFTNNFIVLMVGSLL